MAGGEKQEVILAVVLEEFLQSDVEESSDEDEQLCVFAASNLRRAEMPKVVHFVDVTVEHFSNWDFQHHFW